MSRKSGEFRQAVLDRLRQDVDSSYGWLSDLQYQGPELSHDLSTIEFSDGGSLDIDHLAAIMEGLFQDFTEEDA